MPRLRFHSMVLAGLLLSGFEFPAHSQTISSSTPGSALTTGMVGVTNAQTAQLNALNLQPVIPGVTAVACPATLEFYDDTGALLKQLAVTNISPSTAVSLAFKPIVPATATNGRAPIRAVIFMPSTGATNTGSGSPMMPVVPVSIGCNIMASLEIIDDATGETHTFTTDLRAMAVYRVLPLSVAH